jgi:hypothetical protein
MRLSHLTKFGEFRTLEFTFEAFNLLNRLNYSSVNNTVGPTFDASITEIKGRDDVGPSSPLGFTSAFDPRRIQLGVRFRF